MPALVGFDNTSVKRHCRIALHWLRSRDTVCTSLGREALDQAAGHLKAIQKATGLTPPQLCDVLHIHGWRRRAMMPQTTRGLRFRMSEGDRALARVYRLKRQRPTDAEIEARPSKRVRRFKLTDTQTDDPLAP